MKLSLQWLTDHVDLAGIPPDEIARQLTMKTALIEGVQQLGAGLERVVIGHVVSREKHPNADRLSACRVDVGGSVLDVVCGAPNVAAGQKIAYAPVGCTLPNGLTLEARKIRGVMSHGMICSTDELGLGGDHDGILVLPADAPVGASFRDFWGVADAVFEIDNKSVTHRADLWGHHGFARELAAIFSRPLRPLAVDAALRPDPTAFPLRVDDPVGCPCYLAMKVELETVPETPRWMARRLEAAGMRPIGLLVDLSNYVMLETGQPTHPFDLDRIAGRRIMVRRGRAGERLVTLDGQSRELDGEDLVIADAERGVAIAGVMGGRETEVSASTRRMLLESAAFEAVRVRRTSGRLGLRSEAVARFEKTLDAGLPELALRRYAFLLKQIAPAAKVDTAFAAAGGAHPRTPTLQLRPERARTKLGMAISDAEMTRHLESIGFEVRADGDRIAVVVPSFRARRDVVSEDDLIEEIGRLAGYERAVPKLPRLAVKPPVPDAARQLERLTVRCLVHECAYSETIGYSFATDRQIELYESGAPAESHVRLTNSLTVDATRMRRSLVPGLLETTRRNLVEFDDVRLFEVGREYHPRARAVGAEQPPDADAALPEERRVLVAVRAARGVAGDALLARMRSDVERLMVRLAIRWRGEPAEPQIPPFAHPGRSIAMAVDGRRVGVLAQLHPELGRRFEIGDPVAIVAVDLGALVTIPRALPRMKAISAFPPSRRDLAFVAPDSVTIADLEREIRAAAGDALVDLELFDVYRGPNVPAGRRSLAFRLVFRALDRTLSDAELEPIQRRVIECAAGRGAVLRG